VFFGTLGVSCFATAAPHVVVISMDTTRASALSCYELPTGIRRSIPQVTPNLDGLAANGTRFAHFYTHAPTTLNSHTTMFTGLDPHEHGVPSNGYPYTQPNSTFAERLKMEGYQTVAVVGASALEKAMGLDRGFDVYDDRLSQQHRKSYQDDASGVVQRVFQQLDGRQSDTPLFLFVHFYDPHGPLTPPLAYRQAFVAGGAFTPLATQPWSRGAYMRRVQSGNATVADHELGTALYLAEVAYMDAQIGQLLKGLEARGFLNEALVVATADHGQNLAEHGRNAFSHGFDVHSSVMHVPLIIRGFGLSVPQGRVVQRTFGMSGLAPTMEALLGLPVRLGQARSFASALGPGPVWDQDGWPSRPTVPVFMEATRPYMEESETWNNLQTARGVRIGGLKASVQPSSPAAALSEHQPPWWGLLTDMVQQWDLMAPNFREKQFAEDTQKALEALGYIEPSSSD